jgi:hypothetical protein
LFLRNAKPDSDEPVDLPADDLSVSHVVGLIVSVTVDLAGLWASFQKTKKRQRQLSGLKKQTVKNIDFSNIDLFHVYCDKKGFGFYIIFSILLKIFLF